MKEYEVSFVFFIENEDIESKDELLDALDEISEIEYDDVYDDGEDWNIECTATIKSGATRKIDDAIDNKLKKLLDDAPYAAWDYHYIKGIDNDFYWQP